MHIFWIISALSRKQTNTTSKKVTLKDKLFPPLMCEKINNNRPLERLSGITISLIILSTRIKSNIYFFSV